MKKGQIYEGVVERVEFPNKGIIRCEEETAVVKNVIPGQKVSFLVNKKRKGKAEGRLLEVLERRPMNRRQTVRILRPVGDVLIRMFLMKSSLNSKKTKCVNYCSLHLKNRCY